MQRHSITHLCSCGERRSRWEPSQRWRQSGDAPESSRGVAASPSWSLCRVSGEILIENRLKKLSLSSDGAQFGLQLQGWGSEMLLEWLDYFSELLALRTSAAHWTGLLDASAPSIPLLWREGTHTAGYTHSQYPPHSPISLSLHLTLVLCSSEFSLTPTLSLFFSSVHFFFSKRSKWSYFPSAGAFWHSSLFSLCSSHSENDFMLSRDLSFIILDVTFTWQFANLVLHSHVCNTVYAFDWVCTYYFVSLCMNSFDFPWRASHFVHSRVKWLAG